MSATVIAEPPKKSRKPVATASEPPPPSRWKDKTLAALHTLLRARDYFVPPPAGTALGDYFAARDLLLDADGVEQARWNQLLLSSFDGKPSVIADAIGSQLDRLASQLASKDGLSDRPAHVKLCVGELLRETDNCILAVLRAGQSHERIIAVPQSKAFPISAAPFGWDIELSACRQSDLPDGLNFDWFRDSEGRPAAILAPMLHSIVGHQAHRDWVLTSTARWWTARISLAQKRRRREKAATYDEFIALQRDGIDPHQPLAAKEPELPHPDEILDRVQRPADWLSGLRLALSIARNVREHLMPPDATVPLGDLLDIRQALDHRDHEVEAVKYATERFVAATTGNQRWNDLRDWLRAIVRVVEPRVRRATADGIRFAAILAEREAARGR